jgi:chromosome segregation ATPase
LSLQVFTLKIDFSSFVELSDLKGDSYAESLVQTINTALANKGGRIEAIQDLLANLYDKLVTDQKHADLDWRKRETQLNKTISSTEDLIQKLATQIVNAQKNLALTIKKISKSEQNLAQYTKQLTQDQAMVQTLHIKRNADAAIYKQNLRNHQDLILALDAVIAELNKLRGSISGLGKPGHVDAISAENRDSAWKKAHPALLEVFSESDISSFAQVATEADQDQLSKLIDMLVALKRSTQKSLADDDENEQDSVKHFKKALTRLQSDITLLNITLKRQRENLAKYKRQKVSLETEIRSKTALKVKNENFLAQTKEIRRQEGLKYESDIRARNREKEIIRKLQKIVDEKLARMKEFLKKRVNQ